MTSTFVVAGTGRPHALVTDERRRVLFAALDGGSLTELDELAEEGLLRDRRVAFLVAGAGEVSAARAAAAPVGEELARRVERAWPRLAAAAPRPLESDGFLLVGDLVLDQALLDALAEDGALMPPAPERRCGRYYAWLVEGPREAAGHYGQRASELADGHVLVSFGRYERPAREALGEVTCWFDHRAYAHAIDVLHGRGLLAIPPDGWTAVVAGPGGPGSAFSGSP